MRCSGPQACTLFCLWCRAHNSWPAAASAGCMTVSEPQQPLPAASSQAAWCPARCQGNALAHVIKHRSRAHLRCPAWVWSRRKCPTVGHPQGFRTSTDECRVAHTAAACHAGAACPTVRTAPAERPVNSLRCKVQCTLVVFLQHSCRAARPTRLMISGNCCVMGNAAGHAQQVPSCLHAPDSRRWECLHQESAAGPRSLCWSARCF